MTLTAEQLRTVMPHLTTEHADLFVKPLNAALAFADISTPLRVAAFLAQVAHESAELRWWSELASGAEYEGRKDLGNDQAGDGERFKGRGPLQLTGRVNYHLAGRVMGEDLEDHPDLVTRPEEGFKAAAWFWASKRLNELADQKDLVGITRRINGGLTGLESRLRYYHKALEVLCPQLDT